MDETTRRLLARAVEALEQIAKSLETLAEEPKEQRNPRIDGFGRG